MNKVRLKDVCEAMASNIAQKDISVGNGDYPIYGASGFIGNVDFYKQEKPYIGIVKDGAGVGRAYLLPEKSSVIGTMQYILPKDNIDIKYLYYAIQYMHLEKYYSGATIPHIYFRDYQYEPILLPGKKEQEQKTNVLEKIDKLVFKHKKTLRIIDTLVKSRFVEMFGDPIVNSKGLPTEAIGDVCLLKAGVTTSAQDIHEQSDDEHNIPCYGGNGVRGYVRTATYQGDYAIIGRQGALCGNVQFAHGNFHATEHAVLVTPKIPFNLTWLYITLREMNLNRFHTGAAQPGLAVKTLNKVRIMMPDIELQNRFEELVVQADKSKLSIQQSIETLQTLKAKLMQDYFG